MNGFKILSVILAVLLAACYGTSAVLFHQFRDQIAEAVSRGDTLESRCRQLESERAKRLQHNIEPDPIVEPGPNSQDEMVSRLQEMLEFRESEYADLSRAYETLQAEYDALQEEVGQMPGANLPPEALAMLSRVRERFGRRDSSPEERAQSREEFDQQVIEMLQNRIDSMPDERIQQNLMQIADSFNSARDLARQLRQATDEETRTQIGSVLREEAQHLQQLVREERDLELVYAAEQFGVKDIDGFLQTIEKVNNSPLQRLARPFGMHFARGRSWQR